MEINPKGIIVHSMGEYISYNGEDLYAKDFLKVLGLSVHGFIKPDGLYDKMIDSPNKALHAGLSFHEPYKNLNNYYLGFELLVQGTHDYTSFLKAIHREDTYTENQFRTALEVCRYWIKKYDIPNSRVVRHCDVSGDDVRGKGKGKKDPGPGFDWDRFKLELDQ